MYIKYSCAVIHSCDELFSNTEEMYKYPNLLQNNESLDLLQKQLCFACVDFSVGRTGISQAMMLSSVK